MARLQPFQRHAITPPAFDHTKLHRARLVEILQDNLWRKLILVIAPAGYGKTTLLADLTAHTDRPVCWVRLTEHDQDPMRMAGVLVQSLRTRFPRARKQLDLRGLESLPPEGVGRTLAAAMARAIPLELLLIIDDLHLLSASQGSAAFLSGLLGAAPQGICSVLSGREMPDLPLAKPAADGNILTIGAGDLALMEDELEGVLAPEEGSPVDEATRRRLLAETKGWVAGVLLLRLRGLEALKASAPNGKELTFEYFAAEVLGKQSDELKDFVVRSSVLPVMTAEAVEQVLRVEDGGRWLRLAVRKGLFLSPSGASPRTYEFHPLFREFLLMELEKEHGSIAQPIRIRAASFLEKHGAEEQAVDLLWAAGARRRALRMAARAAPGRKLLAQVGTLQRWVDLADEEDSAAVELRVELIEATSNIGHNREAHRLIQEALRNQDLSRLERLRLKAWDLRMNHGSHSRSTIAAAKSILRSVRSERASHAFRNASAAIGFRFWETGRNLARAEAYAHAAVGASRGSRNEWFRMNHLMLLGAILHARGCAAQEKKIDILLKAAGDKWGGVAQTIGVETGALWAHRELQWEDALAEYEKLKCHARELGVLWRECLAEYELAEIRSNLGLYDAAICGYEATLDLMKDCPDSKVEMWSLVGIVRSFRRAGDLPQAREALKRTMTIPSVLRGSLEITQERLALDLVCNGPRVLPRLESLVRRVSRVSGPAYVEMMSMYFVSLGLWKAGRASEAVHAGSAVVRFADKIAYLHYLTGELVANPAFARFITTELPSEPATRKISRGLHTARQMARREVLVGSTQNGDRRLSLRTLGEASISLDGVAIRLKPLFLEVLTYVVDAGRIPLEQVMEAFWPDAPAERQRTNLHTAVYGIRKALGSEAIIREGAMLCSGPLSRYAYDARDFEELCRECTSLSIGGSPDQRIMRRALLSYGGSFLRAGTRSWVVERRRELEEHYLHVASMYGGFCLEQGRAGDAAGLVLRAMGRDPFDESLRLLAARLLSASGRRAQSIHILRDYRGLIEREMGFSPSVELQELERQLEGEVCMSISGICCQETETTLSE